MFTIKQGDLWPPIDDIVKDAAGAAVDVSGATIKFSMRASRSPTTVKINQATGAIVDGPSGKIRYTPAGADTDTPGTYEGEFLISAVAGGPMRVPTDGWIPIVVEEKVA